MSTENKTETLRSTIFKAILNGDYQPGEKLPTEREMAVMTGTSRITVRRAFDQLEDAGILLREQGRGTFVATHNQGNSSAMGQIALLTSIRDTFALEFIRALERELIERDLLLVLRLTDDEPEKEEEAAIDLVGKGVHNLIIWPSAHAFVSRTFERLRVLGANMVFFDRMQPGAYADYVGLDNRHALAALFAYAETRGMGAPVFVKHSDINPDSDRLREQAFLEECAVRGIRGQVIALPHNGLVLSAPEGICNGATYFCVNDDIALKLLPYVPAKQLYGIDGTEGTGIVSYRQPMAQMAKAAVMQLLNQQKKGAGWKASSRYFMGDLVNVEASG